ncbi:MAG: histidinol dehydrogenase [Lentisphaerae bacterium GWF2_52_8]|nr:MAG: histidinol dehydrogenase [Lentisphaerae bacterium GWF2_52_8]
MKKISWRQKNFDTCMSELYRRPSYPHEIEASVKEILEEVKRNGDAALVKYAKKFDGAKLSPASFAVSQAEIDAAAQKLDASSKRAIATALKNITQFARATRPESRKFTPRKGVMTGERFEPLSRVGVYIPGGSAPLVSTVLHTAGLAHAAGVREIVAITPPGKTGAIAPAMLYALNKAGVSEIYRLGGVYGIAALAYGTKSIRKVEKIVGPGNAYVTAAKKLVFGEVAIDMVAGPSEIMILADRSARPDFIAADMLSQAEHGSGHEQAVLVSDCTKLLAMVEKELTSQAAELTRSETVRRVLEKGVFLIEARNMPHAAELASCYAPEHLEIICSKPEKTAARVRAAGAMFLGQWTPEPVGDFTAGPSHVLPTAGSARFFSGLTVRDFYRRMSIIRYDEKALRKEAGAIVKFAEMEGLDAHGKSASIRLK